MSRVRRLLALVGCAVLLLAAACDRDQPETTEEPTEEPTATPSVSSLGEFQLVAVIEQAFLSIEPDIDLPADVTQQADVGAEQEAAGVSGVMRGELEAFSDNLGQQCNADEGDRFNLYWTAGTLFDETLTNRSLELSLDGRRVGVIGTMFRMPQAGDAGEDFDLDQQTAGPTTAAPATTTPVASPGVTTSEGEDNCVLVVEQVGISQGALPTARPTGSPARTATPSPTPTRTPTPTPPRTPTPSPSPATPSPSPTDTASPSATP